MAFLISKMYTILGLQTRLNIVLSTRLKEAIIRWILLSITIVLNTQEQVGY